jgi:para-nitrobenzyl esterase
MTRLWPVSVLLVALLAPPPAASQADPVVATREGKLSGLLEDGLAVFKGVPYAAPPTGRLRWREPRPVAAWSGIRSADAFGPACVQPRGLKGGVTSEAMSEDCLTLNVWSPRPDAAARLPVMVWLHGGSFRVGAGSLAYYDGAELAKRGAVVVTVNYRLGYLGFFAHPALEPERGPVNFGLLDQIAALEWVRRNIAAFGGDPANVTLFGESAGGISVLRLMTSPLARGLFHKAIVQSGGGWNEAVTREAASQDGVRAAAAMGMGPGLATAERLREAPPEWLANLGLTSLHTADFGPIRGDAALPSSPVLAFARGDEARVPLLIGANSFEGSLLADYGVPASVALGPFASELAEVRRVYGGVAEGDRLAQEVWATETFLAPARWVARVHSQRAPTWLYHFDYVAAAHRTFAPWGAPHGGELLYVFGSYEKVPYMKETFAERDREVARALGDYWVAFARSGAPAVPGLPAWPAYTSTKDVTLVFGASVAARDGFLKARLDFHTSRFERKK